MMKLSRVFSGLLAGCLLSSVVSLSGVFADVESAPGNLARPGFHTAVKDGRLWVFREGSPEWKTFEKDGELGKSVSRIGGGPKGMTIRAPDSATIDAYMNTGH